MTECKTERVQFHALGSREVCGQFDGGDISSDAGGLLLREVEKRTGILKQFAGCFQDYRDPRFVEHRIEPLVAQRVYGLCLGYEDLNDHDQLRSDPVLAVMVDETDPKGRTRKQERDRGKALAGKSTLNRLELSTEGAASHPYKKTGRDEAAMDRLMVDVFLQAHRRAPRQIILDLDATDDPIHGNQEGRFFHGYYRHYCYLPLYIFCGEFLLCARLRSSDIDGAAGTVEELERIVGQIRQEWPRVQIVIRADSGFCRDEILSWCEAQHRVDYVIGLAKNKRLLRAIETPMEKAKQRFDRTGKSARVFKTFQYRTLDSWTRERRVIGKAEHLAKGANPRFIVTSLPKGQPTQRCCMDRGGDGIRPFPSGSVRRYVRTQAVRVRSCVQNFLADLDLRDLPGEATGLESGADDTLPTADLRFYPAALVVPCGHLPGHAAVAADRGNMAIPNGWIPRRLRSGHCVLWRRYNHIQGLPIPFPQQIPCGRSIIGTVSQKARDRGIELIQEPG